MIRIMLMVLLISAFADCRNKKIKLADDDTVDIVDFVEFFPEVKLPYQITDSILLKRETGDSATIGLKIFSQFVPDSILNKQFGKGAKPKLYPLGRVEIKKLETYLFLKAVSSSKKIGYILAFDKDNKFITGMPLVNTDKDRATMQSGGIDARYTVYQNVERKNADGQFNEGKKRIYSEHRSTYVQPHHDRPGGCGGGAGNYKPDRYASAQK